MSKNKDIMIEILEDFKEELSKYAQSRSPRDYGAMLDAQTLSNMVGRVIRKAKYQEEERGHLTEADKAAINSIQRG